MKLKVIALEMLRTKPCGFSSMLFHSFSQHYYSTLQTTSLGINIEGFSVFMFQFEYKHNTKLSSVLIQC